MTLPSRPRRTLTAESQDGKTNRSRTVRSVRSGANSIASASSNKTRKSTKKNKSNENKTKSHDKPKIHRSRTKNALEGMKRGSGYIRNDKTNKMRLKKLTRRDMGHTTKRRVDPAINSTSMQSDNPHFGHDISFENQIIDDNNENDSDEDEDDIDDAQSLSSESSSDSLDDLLEMNARENEAPLLVNSNSAAFGGTWITGLKDTSWIDGNRNNTGNTKIRVTQGHKFRAKSNARITDVATIKSTSASSASTFSSSTSSSHYVALQPIVNNEHPLQTHEQGFEHRRNKTLSARLLWRHSPKNYNGSKRPSVKSATGLHVPIKSIRRFVSKNRSRFVDHEYDLDLSYITPRIVAMGYPSTGLDKYYRNAASTVFRFFETNHQHHYRVYNLCINRRYPDKSDLRPHVARYGFFDHNPCPMQTLRSLCLDIDLWLSEHPDNIAAIHCKAGKGRTGLVVSAYLIHSGAVHNAEDAIRLFGNKRTKDGKGVTIPSQHRYVRYYELAMNNEKLMRRIEGPISAGVIFHLVAVTFHSVDVTWPAPQAQSIKLRVLAPDAVLMAKTKFAEYYPRSADVPAQPAPKFAHGFELGMLGLSNTGEIIKDEHSSPPSDTTATAATDSDTTAGAGIANASQVKRERRRGHIRQESGKVIEAVGNMLFGGSLPPFSSGQGSTAEALDVPAPPACGFAMVRPATPIRVQGDTRLHVLFASKRMTGPGKPSTTMFQCWFNTNFLPVSNVKLKGEDADPEETNFEFAGAVNPTELGDSRARSCVSLLKIELDGRIRKDKAHKIAPANFIMAMHFIAARNQPNVDLSTSAKRLDF